MARWFAKISNFNPFWKPKLFHSLTVVTEFRILSRRQALFHFQIWRFHLVLVWVSFLLNLFSRKVISDSSEDERPPGIPRVAPPSDDDDRPPGISYRPRRRWHPSIASRTPKPPKQFKNHSKAKAPSACRSRVPVEKNSIEKTQLKFQIYTSQLTFLKILRSIYYIAIMKKWI